MSVSSTSLFLSQKIFFHTFFQSSVPSFRLILPCLHMSLHFTCFSCFSLTSSHFIGLSHLFPFPLMKMKQMGMLACRPCVNSAGSRLKIQLISHPCLYSSALISIFSFSSSLIKHSEMLPMVFQVIMVRSHFNCFFFFLTSQLVTYFVNKPITA